MISKRVYRTMRKNRVNTEQESSNSELSKQGGKRCPFFCCSGFHIKLGYAAKGGVCAKDWRYPDCVLFRGTMLLYNI